MDYPIVMQGLPRWDHPYASTAITLAKQFSASRKVIYVEHPFTWKDRMNSTCKDAFQRREQVWKTGKEWSCPFEGFDNLVVVSPLPHTPINFLPENPVYQALRKNISKSIANLVERAMAELGIGEYVYINSFDPVWNDLPKFTTQKAVLTVYHGVDFMGGERYIARHGVAAEKEAVANADLVVATSDPLKAKYAALNPQAEVVYNGVDFRHFQTPNLPEPEELQQINGLKLVYAGNLGLRIDYAFIEQAVKYSPEVHWVLIGPIDQREFNGKALFELPNVHFLGAKPYSDLPAYLQYADACVIPFECNELTRCIYPLKINEYLAAGRPVLSTPFAPLPQFSGLVNYYTDLMSFSESLQQAIQSDGKKEEIKRKLVAVQNDWQHRAEQFLELVETAIKKKRSCHF